MADIFNGNTSADPAENSDGESAESLMPKDPPDSFLEVKDTLMDTLLSIWEAFVAHLPLFAFGLASLFVTWGISRLAAIIVRKVLTKRGIRPSLVELFCRLTSIVVWTLGLLVAAMIVFPGLTPTSALGGLGILSIAIGFAFQDIFENFFAGILLLWKYPFEQGDYIECEGIEGEVKKINIRMTLIRKPTDELLVVPNSFLFKNPVKVLTHQNRRRIGIITGVGYDEDVAQACEVIEHALKTCKTVDQEHEVQVFAQGFGSSSMDIEVEWWTEPTPLAVRRSRGEVVIAIKAALDDAGIEIPYPYRTLTFKEALPIQSSAKAKAAEAEA